MIQEIVDAHKEQMPTGAVSAVMAECQAAYDDATKLYKLTWTWTMVILSASPALGTPVWKRARRAANKTTRV